MFFTSYETTKRTSCLCIQVKIEGYLLSPTHPDGKGKHDFFVRFGFQLRKSEELVNTLKQHALDQEITSQEQTPFGMRYVVEGILVCPDGRNPNVRVIWFVDKDETIPRLVTAYPVR